MPLAAQEGSKSKQASLGPSQALQEPLQALSAWPPNHTEHGKLQTPIVSVQKNAGAKTSKLLSKSRLKQAT